MPICPNCGEYLEGDGYSTVYHCPYADESTYEYHEPDAHPVYCLENTSEDF